MDARVPIGYSTCPHDCPSTCALEVELLEGGRIGRVRGAKSNTYTSGVVCAKVARYAERVHHPDRLLHPLRRIGPKGSGRFERISWDDALDITAEAMLKAEQAFGSQSVWPYYYAGTMGLLMRDGINRLRHAKRYAGQYNTICVTLPAVGFRAATGAFRGPDPREMAKSDLVVIWGTNPVNTQVNVMTHVARARKERGAKLVAIDVYRNGTVEAADLGLVLKPGTDAALACAVMHVLFRDGYANWPYLEKYTDCPRDLEQHVRSRTPEWASAITGLTVGEIETFARMVGTTPRTFFRLGYGFARSRNGVASIHAAASIPCVTGAWLHEGGGAFHKNMDLYKIDRSLIEGLDVRDPAVRQLDQSRIGPVLVNDPHDLRDGPPVKALLIQNTNPVQVAPEQRKVKAGFARDDLFVCVHEQFMTATAQMADVVIPATMFLEHDDIYTAGGHQHLQPGARLLQPPGECRSNHDVICAIARRVGASHRGFEMSPAEILDATLQASGLGTWEDLVANRWIDLQPDFETSHFINGFGHSDGKFHFAPDWAKVTVAHDGSMGPVETLPKLPDYWTSIELADETHPFRLATSPSRYYLNSTFNETPTSIDKHGRPLALMHPEDIAALGLSDGQKIAMGNERGEIRLHASAFDGVCRGVVIVEGIIPNDRFEGGEGINTLTGADQPAPFGGAAFHDNHVWIRAA
ncbi:MAG: molybdopterin-dependent oxidoreductase [Pseudorhodoplanes sp.]